MEYLNSSWSCLQAFSETSLPAARNQSTSGLRVNLIISNIMAPLLLHSLASLPTIWTNGPLSTTATICGIIVILVAVLIGRSFRSYLKRRNQEEQLRHPPNTSPFPEKSAEANRESDAIHDRWASHLPPPPGSLLASINPLPLSARPLATSGQLAAQVARERRWLPDDQSQQSFHSAWSQLSTSVPEVLVPTRIEEEVANGSKVRSDTVHHFKDADLNAMWRRRSLVFM